MNSENLQLTLDADEEREHHLMETSTVISGGALPSADIFGMPEWPIAFVPVTATVNIGGTVFVYTEPTPQWLTIYPAIQHEPSLGVLEDLDIPFKPKRTRMTKGVVMKRSKARFKTAFADDLVDEMDIGK